MYLLKFLIIGFIINLHFLLTAFSFVSSSQGGRPGEWDVLTRFNAVRGLVEPDENVDSHQSAEINEYTLGLGYTLGNWGSLKDLYFNLQGMYFTSADEIVDGTTFYSKDSGAIITPTISANLIHERSISFGLYLQGSIPMSMNIAKFSNPRIDTLAGGTTVGVRMNDWLGFFSRLFVGSGISSGINKQNGAVALSNMFIFEAQKWFFPYRSGIMIGPYVETDFVERFDSGYDDVFSATGRQDRIRAMRFAITTIIYLRFSPMISTELGYVQKLFGYDARATRDYFGAIRLTF